MDRFFVTIEASKLDLFVQWDGGEVSRPVLFGILHSGNWNLLTYRICETESSLLARMAFADLHREYGIPDEALLDNGRAYASQIIAAGVATRFRFTPPYRGLPSPGERIWRGLCEDIVQHPAVSRAVLRDRAGAHPESYRDRAILIRDFADHVAAVVASHNTRGAAFSALGGGRHDY